MTTTAESGQSLENVVRHALSLAIGHDQTTTPGDTPLAECGMDSLAAIKVAAQISMTCQVRLALTDLIGDTTIDDLVQLVAAGSSTPTPEPSTPTAPPRRAATLTPIQAAYWSGRGTDFPLGGVASWWYHEYHRPPCPGSPEDDIATLEVAWRRVVAHHDMLRTVINRDGDAELATHDVRDFHIPRIDLRTAPQPEAELAALRDRLSHQVRPSDTWPLFDIQVVFLPDGSTHWFVGFDVLVIDFTSWGIIMDHWDTLTHHPDQQLPTTDRSFAQILQDRHHDNDYQQQRAVDKAWWADQNIPAGPQLPWADVPDQGARFTRHQRTIDADTWQRIQQLATAAGVTATSVVLAAFTGTLSRRVSAPDFTINITMFDRPVDGSADNLVGDFTTTALVPFTQAAGFDTDSAATMGELAAAANKTLWNCLEHRAYAGVEVASDRGDRGSWPVVFTSGLGTPSAQADEWLGERAFSVSQTPQVLLDHLVWEEHGALVLTIDAVDGSLPSGFVDHLLDAELAALRGLATQEAWAIPGPFWDLSGEPRAMSMAVSHSGAQIHDPWLAQQPEALTAPAAICGTDQMTHQQVYAAATALADQLVTAGVKPGDLVMVAVPKGCAQIVAVMAVEIVGAGYVPVDPAWPVRRKQSIVRRTGLWLAIVADPAVDLPETIRPLQIDDAGQAVGQLPTAPANLDATNTGQSDPDQTDTGQDVAAADQQHCREVPLAYTIFTSGSTGEPKGVAITHDQARCTIDEINRRFSITADDRVFGVSALSFDLSVYDIFGMLGAGGATVMPTPGRERDPGHWLDLIAEHKITVWNSAPALFEMFIEFIESDPTARQKLASLRLVMLSGDWIPVTLPERVWALAPQAEFHSLGGATEAAIWSINYPVTQVDPTWPSVPYGRPLPEQSFVIMADGFRPTKLAETGELLIGGHGVASGYIGDPERSAAQFITHPDTGERFYRTGDEGRWRPDGTIQFLGRIDRQVKINGHRIELGEVEAAMHRLPAIRQAAVLAMPGPDGRPRLVAHYSLANAAGQAANTGADQSTVTTQSTVTAQSLSEQLLQQVPGYMVPQRFVELPALPVSANGKIDTKALQNPWKPAENSAGQPSSTSAPQAAEKAAAPAGADQPMAAAAASAAAPTSGGQTAANQLDPAPRIIDLRQAEELVAAGATTPTAAGLAAVGQASASDVTARAHTGQPPATLPHADQPRGEESAGGARTTDGVSDAGGISSTGAASSSSSVSSSNTGAADSQPLVTAPAVAALLAEVTDFDVSPLQAGLSSLDLVRLANALEDHHGSRPDMVTLMGQQSLRTILTPYQVFSGNQPATDVASAPVGVTPCSPGKPKSADGPGAALPSGLAVGQPAAAQSLTAALHQLASPRAVAALADDPTATAQLAQQLRFVADALDQVSVQATQAVAQANAIVARATASESAAAPTMPEAQAPSASQAIPATPADSLASPAQAPHDGVLFPLTEMQLAYLVGRAPDQHGRELAPHYFTDARVTGFDLARFTAAWQQVVADHPMLRTITAESGMQRTLPADQVAAGVDVVDLRGKTAAEQTHWLSEHRAAASHRQLPTDQAPMVRWVAAQRDDTEWWLCLDLDLLFCDAASAATWVAELHAHYLGQPVAGNTSSDPSDTNPASANQASGQVADQASESAAAVRFADYAAAGSTPSAQAQQHWDSRLADLPAVGPRLVAPTATKHSTGQQGFARFRAELPADRWQQVQEHARNQSVTATVWLLDALGQVLCGPNRDHASMIMTVDDRPTGHQGVVGDYTATVLVDVDHSRDDSDSDRRHALQRKLAEGLQHSTGPGAVHGNQVIRQLRAQRGGTVDLPVVVSSAIGGQSQVDASALLEMFGSTQYAISQTPGIVVDVQLFEVAGQLRVNWDVDPQLVDAGWVRDQFDRWLQLVAGTDQVATTEQATIGLAAPPTEPDQAGSNKTGSNKTGSNWAGGNRAGGNRAGLTPADSAGTNGAARASSGVAAGDPAQVRADISEALRTAAGIAVSDATGNWFDLGATSVSLVGVHRELTAAGYKLSMVDLFTHTNVSSLAEFLGGSAATTPAPQPVDMGSLPGTTGVGEEAGTAPAAPGRPPVSRSDSAPARGGRRGRASSSQSLQETVALARERGKRRTPTQR